MLQQTQVATVIDYYLRFLSAYPDVVSLAAADEQAVLRLWAGLGYYRRARQMLAAAKLIAQGSGAFPTTLSDIERLPGVGRYTAGAIASFAFGQPAPIVEANTQRLYSRLLRLEIDPRSRAGQSQLWSFAESLLVDHKPRGAGRINQAFMELGSQICTPRNPDCPRCPLNQLCPTFADGLQAAIPMAAPKKVITDLTHVAFIIGNKGKLLMRQNSAEDWWHGLWDFPRVDVTQVASFHKKNFSASDLSSADRDWLASELYRQHGLNAAIASHHSTIKHSVTRYRITLNNFTATFSARAHRNKEYAWHDMHAALALPLTAPAKRILKGL